MFEAGVQETTLSFCTEFKSRVQRQTNEEEATNLCQTTDISSSNYCCHQSYSQSPILLRATREHWFRLLLLENRKTHWFRRLPSFWSCSFSESNHLTDHTCTGETSESLEVYEVEERGTHNKSPSKSSCAYICPCPWQHPQPTAHCCNCCELQNTHWLVTHVNSLWCALQEEMSSSKR